ncbi:hypothetical protein B0H15DRAFT_946007 [Mycena belliarum]|uniref:Uncharacterized protein n=1 Tax=Mycena belliarum TaxID=1033014 RepID=A0AAD6UDB4_9AGAR|nr:hypothetical protein B0H15DRAFT_946007 [Mycena belliae]
MGRGTLTRDAFLRSQSTSPTPSVRHCPELETGHHATDVESEPEEGEVRDEGRRLLRSEFDTAMADVNDERAADSDATADMSVDGDKVRAAITLNDTTEGRTPNHGATTPNAMKRHDHHTYPTPVPFFNPGSSHVPVAPRVQAQRPAQAPRQHGPAPPAQPVDGVHASMHAPPAPTPPPAHLSGPTPTTTFAFGGASGNPNLPPQMFAFGQNNMHPPPSTGLQGTALTTPAAPAASGPPPRLFALGQNAGQPPAPAGPQIATSTTPAAPAAPFAFPDATAHGQATPTCRDENPHQNLPAAPMPAPAGPADVGKSARVQTNTGNFPRLVISQESALECVHERSVDLLARYPSQALYGFLFNGGYEAYKKLSDTLPDKITEILDDFGTPDEFTVFNVATATNTNTSTPREGSNRYAPPLIFGVIVPNPTLRSRLRTQSLFAADPTWTFYLLGAEDFALPWVAALYECPVQRGATAAKETLRAAISTVIWTDATVGVLLDQATSSFDHRSVDERRLALSETVDVRYDTLARRYVVYIKPCTQNIKQWNALVGAICTPELVDGVFIFAIIPKKGVGPRCVICKNEDHFHSHDPLANDPGFWGPKGQLNTIAEGPLAAGRVEREDARVAEGTSLGDGTMNDLYGLQYYAHKTPPHLHKLRPWCVSEARQRNNTGNTWFWDRKKP